MSREGHTTIRVFLQERGNSEVRQRHTSSEMKLGVFLEKIYVLWLSLPYHFKDMIVVNGHMVGHRTDGYE